MQYVVLDLEWNGGWSKKAHGYFNEIIEVGAVMLDGSFTVLDHYRAAIRPVVSKKLSTIVTDLTNITADELENGITFQEMLRGFSAWIGDEPCAILTWSTTDLLVLMENCRYFLQRQEVPFLQYYMDFQAYAQMRMGVEGGQQIGLAKAGELLGISEDDMTLHRALDDSILTAQILQKTADSASLRDAVQRVDEEFYRRITFKSSIICDIDNPLVKREELAFSCPECGKNMRRYGEWHFRNRAFTAEFRCRSCQKKYNGRVQFRIKYEGVECRKKLTEKMDKPQETQSDAAPII